MGSLASALNVVAWIVVFLSASSCMGIGMERNRTELCWVALLLVLLLFVRSVLFLCEVWL